MRGICLSGLLLLAGCTHSEPTSVSNYYDAQQAYAQAIDKVAGQPPAIAVVSPPLFLWDLGRVIQGNNALGRCALPDPGPPKPVNPLPPADVERTFTLGAQVPAAVTNGLISANVDARYSSLVRLDYDEVSGLIVDQVDIDPVLDSPACKKVLAAAIGSVPVTIVRGQIIARQKYTWLQNASASLGAKIGIAPGIEPVGFSVSGTGGPNAPLVLVEDKPQAHFLIVETYQPVETADAPGAGGIEARGARLDSRRRIFTPVATPTATRAAIQSGSLGGALPERP